jgi:divalent metal cation (Fe/Co/Zn/Cd) transporter
MVTHHVEAAQAGLLHNLAAAGGRHSDERWSIGLALGAALVIPAYFFLTPYWNAQYTPIRPWVWAVPGVVCMLYLFAQFWALLHSAGRSSEDIGMKDTVVALLTALSSFGTLVAMLILWFQGNYYFGPFQAMAVGTITATTFGELIFTAWVRYLVNRRYFSSVSQGN